MLHSCSKGVIVVFFQKLEDLKKVFDQGPWLFRPPFSTMVPWLWYSFHVRFGSYLYILENMVNLIGWHIKTDNDRMAKGIISFVLICVEVDLSKGLPDKILLKLRGRVYSQPVDYENTAFCCRTCQQPGHLQNNTLTWILRKRTVAGKIQRDERDLRILRITSRMPHSNRSHLWPRQLFQTQLNFM